MSALTPLSQRSSSSVALTATPAATPALGATAQGLTSNSGCAPRPRLTLTPEHRALLAPHAVMMAELTRQIARSVLLPGDVPTTPDAPCNLGAEAALSGLRKSILIGLATQEGIYALVYRSLRATIVNHCIPQAADDPLQETLSVADHAELLAHKLIPANPESLRHQYPRIREAEPWQSADFPTDPAAVALANMLNQLSEGGVRGIDTSLVRWFEDEVQEQADSHIGECVHPFCALNRVAAPHLRRRLEQDIIVCAFDLKTQHGVGSKTPLRYVSFASGLFAQDQRILRQLMFYQLDNFDITFIDSLYAAREAAPEALRDYASLRTSALAVTAEKAFTQLKEDLQKRCPAGRLRMTRYADIDAYFAANPFPQIDILLGVDFFQPGTAPTPIDATDRAQADFAILRTLMTRHGQLFCLSKRQTTTVYEWGIAQQTRKEEREYARFNVGAYSESQLR